jgi:hypothetical protein
MDLGYVGVIDDDGSFRYRGTISTLLGISQGAELPVSDSDARFTISSGSNVKVNLAAKVDAAGPFGAFANAKVKASITFGASDGFFIAVDGLKIREVAEPETLNLAMLRAYRDGNWQEDFVYVYQVGVAKAFTAILAHQANTDVLLSAKGRVKAGAISDVDLAGKFGFSASTSSVTQLVGGKNIKAFCNVYGVEDRWFHKPKVRQFIVEPSFAKTMTDEALPMLPARVPK